MSVAVDELDLAALHAADPQRFPCLLSSSAPGGRDGRYDLLLAGNGEALVLHADGRLSLPAGIADAGGFLATLRAWQQQLALTSLPAREHAAQVGPGRAPPGSHGEIPFNGPFNGGFCLYLAYEFAATLEPVLRLPAATDGLPVALALRTPAALCRDRHDGSLRAIAEPGFEYLLAELDSLAARAPRPRQPQVQAVTEADGAEFERAVERVLDYLQAGDVFQVNLSRGWQLQLASGNAAGLYRTLMAANPAPFSGWLHWDGIDLISSSPERLLAVREGWVETRPIAGTRPRGRDAEEDRRLLQELEADPKERAEHIMLIDLERNDLGRVCRPGSVEVDEFCAVESYAHVHHLVSNVRGRLAPGRDALDALAATFPGGTITGCPKVRCMQIIAELEGEGRGAYTGALGYLGLDGRLDLNILIRSLVLRGDRVNLRTGAGIVADSVPARELAETRSKARGLLRALGLARTSHTPR